MATQTLRDNLQRIIGYIETDPDGLQIGRDAAHRLKGSFHADSNTTRDPGGRIVGYGNQLVQLIANG